MPLILLGTLGYMASKARPCNKHELARRGYVNAGLGLCKEITMIKSGSYNLEKNMVEIIINKVWRFFIGINTTAKLIMTGNKIVKSYGNLKEDNFK
jgi:hypothetical protein